MKFILYRFVLNLKWFCSNIIRCLIASIFIVLPYSIATIYPLVKVGGWAYFPMYMLSFLGGMALFFTIMLRVLGFLSKKIHPPLKWKNSDDKTIKPILNILLIIPLIGLIGVTFQSDTHPIDYFIWTEISVVSTLLLYLLNRNISNEDQELANSQPPKVTAENMTPKQLRNMRIGGVIQAGVTIILMILYFRTDIKLDEAERKLQIQYYESTNIKEQLQFQIDSLTSELSKIKQDTIPNTR